MSKKQQREYPMPPWEIDDKSAMYRGKYIQAVSYIEAIIDHAIATYFCKGDFNRLREFTYSVLASDKMSLSAKHDVFCFIAQRHCHKIYKKHYDPYTQAEKKKMPTYVGLHNRIGAIFSTRNKLAHRFSFSLGDKEEDYDKISYATRKAEKGILKYNSLELDDNVMDEFLKEVRAVTDILEEVSGEILKVKKSQAVIHDPNP